MLKYLFSRRYEILVPMYQKRKDCIHRILSEIIRECNMDKFCQERYILSSSGLEMDMTSLNLWNLSTTLDEDTLHIYLSGIDIQKIYDLFGNLMNTQEYDEGYIINCPYSGQYVAHKSSVKKDVYPEEVFHDKEMKAILRAIDRSPQANILLYGHPGVGKTSMIKKISELYGACLFVMTNWTSSSDIRAFLEHDEYECIHARRQERIFIRPKKKFIVFEDIDAEKIDKEMINLLDGLIQLTTGYIFFTASSLEGLSESFYRSGRMDCVSFLGDLEHEEILRFISLKYPNEKMPRETFKRCSLHKLYEYFSESHSLDDFVCRLEVSGSDNKGSKIEPGDDIKTIRDEKA